MPGGVVAAEIWPWLRMCSYAALVGGVVLVAADLQHLAPDFMDPGAKFSDTVQTPLWLLHGVTHLVATSLLLGSIVGLALLHTGRFGVWGRAAAAGAFLLTSAYLGVSYVMTFAAPHIPAEILDAPASGAMGAAFAAYPLSAIALFVFGIFLVRARVVKRWAAITFSAGAILQPVTDVLAGVVFLPFTGALVLGVGLAGLGMSMHELSTPAAEHAPATIPLAQAP